jgi:hypothetical protein
MTRGNQRDANRERAEKRKDKAEGGKKREGALLRTPICEAALT